MIELAEEEKLSAEIEWILCEGNTVDIDTVEAYRNARNDEAMISCYADKHGY